MPKRCATGNLSFQKNQPIYDSEHAPFDYRDLMNRLSFQTIPRSSPCNPPHDLHLLHTPRRKNHNITQRNIQSLARNPMPLAPALVKYLLSIRS